MKERVAEAPYGAYNSPQFVGLESSFMPCRFEIGPWVLDTESNTVYRNGRVIRLEPKVVEVCARLAERAGEVVRKEELIGAVWPDTFVTDDVLSRSERPSHSVRTESGGSVCPSGGTGRRGGSERGTDRGGLARYLCY